MFKIPQYHSLPNQTADIIAGELQRGAWRGQLPAERELCEQLQVSRTTLRKALRILRQRGLIRTVARQATLVTQNVRRRRLPAPGRSVGLLLGEVPGVLSGQNRAFFGAIEHFLFKQGYQCSLHVLSQIRGRNPLQRLEDLVARSRMNCWAICSMPESAQKWFVDKDIPALVLGSCYPGVSLPELDVDYESICRHAVSVLLRLGHCRLAYLAPNRRFAGDLLAENGFQDCVARSGRHDLQTEIIRHDSTTAGVCRALEKCFRSPKPLTGFIVSRALAVVTAASWLIQRGLNIPGDISLICRDADPVLEAHVPAITHYRADEDAYARQCARILVKLAESGAYATRATRLTARFTPGGTIASPNKKEMDK